MFISEKPTWIVNENRDRVMRLVRKVMSVGKAGMMAHEEIGDELSKLTIEFTIHGETYALIRAIVNGEIVEEKLCNSQTNTPSTMGDGFSA